MDEGCVGRQSEWMATGLGGVDLDRRSILIALNLTKVELDEHWIGRVSDWAEVGL